ncbi:MAG: hypothetical protein IRZ16_18055 [Myxococcaceae bacterium]|nr:hypothetical protein [Myxococcaceae bacterium]
MTKMAAAVAVVFAAGAGVMSLFGSLLGGAAEAAALGLVGAGLVGSSWVLGDRLRPRSDGTRTPASSPARRVGEVA